MEFDPAALEGIAKRFRQGHLAEAIQWVRAHEVDYRVHVAAARPGAEKAEAWLAERGYERGEGWEKFVRCYVALLDGELCACGSMLIHEGIAELGIDATMEDVRGRGCNRELLRRRLRDAAAAGCHTVFAEMGECLPEVAPRSATVCFTPASRRPTAAATGSGPASCAAAWSRGRGNFRGEAPHR